MRKLALQMHMSADALEDASRNQEPRGGRSASAVRSVVEEWARSRVAGGELAGVLAIAITLLVIEIHPPELHQGETLAHALWQQWPSYAAYLVSFLTIGVIWLNHHRVFTQVIRVDGPLLLLNLHLLLWTALIPFPTAVVAEHLGDGGEAAQTAAALYGGVLLGMSLAFAALFAWVTHTDRLLGRLLPARVVQAARLRFMLGLVVYAAAVALSWVSAPLALGLCGLMALYYAFDQASVPSAAEPDDDQPTRRPA